MTIRSLESTNIYDILEWCRDFHHSGPHVVRTSVRFGIGIYQLGQALEWEGKSVCCNHEGFAAAFLHFAMVGEDADCMLEENLEHCEHITAVSKYRVSDRDLLKHICLAQQQVHYKYSTSSKLSRKSRYSRKALITHLGAVCRFCIASIPSSLRKKALSDASSIMCGRL